MIETTYFITLIERPINNKTKTRKRINKRRNKRDNKVRCRVSNALKPHSKGDPQKKKRKQNITNLIIITREDHS